MPNRLGAVDAAALETESSTPCVEEGGTCWADCCGASSCTFAGVKSAGRSSGAVTSASHVDAVDCFAPGIGLLFPYFETVGFLEVNGRKEKGMMVRKTVRCAER